MDKEELDKKIDKYFKEKFGVSFEEWKKIKMHQAKETLMKNAEYMDEMGF